MRNSDSNPTITNSIFSGNSAGQGGGMFNYRSNLTVTGCTFSGNLAVPYPTNPGGFGAGMYNCHSSKTTLINCMFSGNDASESGGGIFNDIGQLNVVTLVNCTFAGNSAPFGSALGCDSYEQCCPSNIHVTNCILWDGGNEIWNNDNSLITITYSDMQGGWSGTGNINADPRFVDAAGGDLRLSSDSPCIDVGNNSTPNLPATDMDGHPRIIDGDCNDTEVVDMGAYEFNYAYMGDFDYNCNVDFVDLSIFGLAWASQPGDFNWDFACNINIPADKVINRLDLAAFADNWLAGF
jgi:hypothetical protein